MADSNQNTSISNETKLENLREELRIEYKKYDRDSKPKLDKILKQIQNLEAVVKKERKVKELQRVNRQHADHRAIILELLSLEMPSEDITVNDGSFHSVKLKKHPSLVKFMANHPHARFGFEKGFYTSCKVGGKDYSLGQTKYEHGKADEFKKFETLSESCQWHGFLEKEMTFAEFTKLETAIIKESQRIKNEIKKSEEKIKSLKSHFLNTNNLIRRYDLRAEEYSSI